MKRGILALALVLALGTGLASPALASEPVFGDVPESHWAYRSVEAVAADGLMNGTGSGMFSPDMKVSIAQFLTLVGRVVFPDVRADSSGWYGPYITAALNAGLLDGTRVDVGQPEVEITRYDMAVILWAAAKELGAADTLAETDAIADYHVIPTLYQDAVRAVYGLGLIQGDSAGRFNGANTMTRAEVATVIRRLNAVKAHVATEHFGEPMEFCSVCGDYMSFGTETYDGVCRDCYYGILDPDDFLGYWYQGNSNAQELALQQDNRYGLSLRMNFDGMQGVDNRVYADWNDAENTVTFTDISPNGEIVTQGTITLHKDATITLTRDLTGPDTQDTQTLVFDTRCSASRWYDSNCVDCGALVEWEDMTDGVCSHCLYFSTPNEQCPRCGKAWFTTGVGNWGHFCPACGCNYWYCSGCGRACPTEEMIGYACENCWDAEAPSPLFSDRTTIVTAEDYSANGYTYRIPQIDKQLLDAEDIDPNLPDEPINAEIRAWLNPIIKDALSAALEGYRTFTCAVDYQVIWHDNYFTLIPYVEYEGGDISYDKVYNIDLMVGRRVSNVALLKKAGMAPEEFVRRAKQSACDYFERYEYALAPDWVSEEDVAYCRELLAQLNEEYIHADMPLFFNEEDQLCMITRIPSFAGAGSYWRIIVVK